MKRVLLYTCLVFGFLGNNAQAQTTAFNFNIIDCNGSQQNLYADLDAGKAVIIEFFMTSCGSCITAGQKLEAMKTDLLAEFPGMIKSYAFGYNNSYSCTSIKNWVNTNGFSAIPSDSGAAQVAYYGGMGMPTIVILGGGTSHQVLGSPYIGFSTSDTIAMAADIRAFLNPTSVSSPKTVARDFIISPNPAANELKITSEHLEPGLFSFYIIDMSGRIINSSQNETYLSGKLDRTIDIKKLPAGTYTLKIVSSDNVFQKKFVVVH